MGYYKNIDAEMQAEVDRIVRWYNEHQHIVPSYILNKIIRDADLMNEVIAEWEEIPEPLPASRHVALQVERRKRKANWSLTSSETKMFMTLYISTMSLVLVAVIGLAVL